MRRTEREDILMVPELFIINTTTNLGRHTRDVLESGELFNKTRSPAVRGDYMLLLFVILELWL